MFHQKNVFLTLFLLFLVFSPLWARSAKQESPLPAPTAEHAIQAWYDGKIEDSIAELEAVIEADKLNFRAKRQLAALYREEGERRKNIALLEDLAENGTNGAKVMPLQLFRAYVLAGERRKAERLLDRADAETAIALDGRLNSPGARRERAEFLFYKGLLRAREDEITEAIGLFQQSLELNRYLPMAWLELGRLLEKRAGGENNAAGTADRREAEICYRTAVSQDAALTEALYPLGRLYLKRGAWKNAADYLGRAARRFPDDEDIAAGLEQARRRLSSEPSAESLIRRTMNANPPKVQPPPAGPSAQKMRIGLAENRGLVSVKAGAAFTISAEGSGVVYRGKAREQLLIARQDESLAVQDMNGRTLVRSARILSLEYADPTATSLVAGVVSGSPGVNRSYRGALEFRPGVNGQGRGFTVVNVVGIEEYLYSVVPSELPASWPAEALKAQAIAARSYAAANLGQFAGRGFDLYGTPHSMAYQGAGNEHKETTAAVDATRGLILFAGTEPLKAYFSANHGGYSEDTVPLWGYEANMKAVPDPFLSERNAPLPPAELDDWMRDAPFTFSSVDHYHFPASYRWEKWVRPDEIRYRLASSGRGDPGKIRRIVSRGRGISGRLTQLEVQGEGAERSVFVRGDAIWPAMGALKSSLFTIDYQFDSSGDIEYVIFRGAGHGHGIGLDQHGAAGMAALGYTAEQILKQYYPKAAIVVM